MLSSLDVLWDVLSASMMLRMLFSNTEDDTVVGIDPATFVPPTSEIATG